MPSVVFPEDDVRMQSRSRAIGQVVIHDVREQTPMDMDSSFALVMSRLRAGDNDAATEVFRRFVPRLIALANRQLETRFRAKADPEDVVQSVCFCFFQRNKRSPFELSDWDGLWSLLAKITVRKCIHRREFWHAARRDVARETGPGPDPATDSWWEAIDQGPTPLQATVLADTIEHLLRRLKPPARKIAELSLQGYTAVEIAARCDCSERTVGRVVSRIRDGLSEIELEIEATEPQG